MCSHAIRHAIWHATWRAIWHAIWHAAVAVSQGTTGIAADGTGTVGLDGGAVNPA